MIKIKYYLILFILFIYIDNKGYKLIKKIYQIFINLSEFKSINPDFFNIYGKNYLNLYIITHKDFKNEFTNKFYKILCDERQQLKNSYNLEIINTNNENELYSKKKGYSEGSKIYYIWKQYKNKNIDSKYVGFNHYSRIFSFMNNIPNLEKIFKYYDVILNNHIDLGKKTIKELYYENHYGPDIENIIDIIKEKFPDYYESALKVLNSNKIYYCNVFIMKKDDFIKYGNFVFSVLSEFDKKHNLKSDNDIKNYVMNVNKFIKRKDRSFKSYEEFIETQSRIEGYLMERLSNVFFGYHFKKIYEIRFKSKKTKIKIIETILIFFIIFLFLKTNKKDKIN